MQVKRKIERTGSKISKKVVMFVQFPSAIIGLGRLTIRVRLGERFLEHVKNYMEHKWSI